MSFFSSFASNIKLTQPDALQFCVKYYGAWSNYNSALNYLCKDQKYRIRATEIAKSEGLISVNRKRKGKSKVSIITLRHTCFV